MSSYRGTTERTHLLRHLSDATELSHARSGRSQTACGPARSGCIVAPRRDPETKLNIRLIRRRRTEANPVSVNEHVCFAC